MFLGEIERAVRSFQRFARAVIGEDIGHPAREAHLRHAFTAVAVYQIARGKIRTGLIDDLAGLADALAAEQQHELLAAMACDMAFFVRNTGKKRSHEAQHPIARIMAMAVVDGLEMIDVAKRYAQRFPIADGFLHLLFQEHLERSAIGQAGQMILLRRLARGFEALLQRLGLFLVLAHLRLNLAGLVDHRAGEIDQGAHQLFGRIGAAFADLRLQRLAIAGSRRSGFCREQIEAVQIFFDRAKHLAQPIDGQLLGMPLGDDLFSQAIGDLTPVGKDRPHRLFYLKIIAGEIIEHEAEINRRKVEIMDEEERTDIVIELTPSLDLTA